MRRLPIFFVIDVSESMVGEPITDVAAGMKTMIQALRQNPHALETAYISVIVFAGKAKTLVPLTEVAAFYPPLIPVGGGTSLAAGLNHLISEIDSKLVKNTGDTKGDWKPVIFLFTDGVPTDDSEQAVREWETRYRSRSNLVAISVGNNADLNLLRRLTDQVLIFNDAKPESYQEFFKWITASISAQSQKVETSSDDTLQLENLNADIAIKWDVEKPFPPRSDENFVVLNGLCQQTRTPYLIKFKRNAPVDEWAEVIYESPMPTPPRSDRAYVLAGAFQIAAPEEYEELSIKTSSRQTVKSGDLAGNPSCPCCASPFGFSFCSCGGIHCTHGAGLNRCPWCGTEAEYGYTEGDDDITRGLG